jgi:cysteine desulfuration protein SufE
MDEILLEEKLELLPPRLREIAEEFQDAEPRERLELLLEYALDMPELPQRLREACDAMEQIHECQTPVFLHTELEGDGAEPSVRFYIDVPPESPTVRGYASILLDGLEGATPAQVLQLPDDVYMLLGLHEAISPQRLRGLHALVAYMKRQVRKLQ